MSESTGFVTLNFTEILVKPSTILNIVNANAPPVEPVINYLSLHAVIERLIINAKDGHEASQNTIKQIVINKFKANLLLAELEAAAMPY